MLIRQTEGLSRLIDDLRVLSLSDSGQLYIYRETVHLKALLHNCVETFNNHLTTSGLKPVIEAADVVCYVDEVRLRQIFIALLSNAANMPTRSAADALLSKAQRYYHNSGR